MEENSVEALENEFQDVLNELVGEKNLQKFRVEYEKLFTVLKRSHENEKRLMTKCRELKAEISSNSSKIMLIVKQCQEAETSNVSLKKVKYEYKGLGVKMLLIICFEKTNCG